MLLIPFLPVLSQFSTEIEGSSCLSSTLSKEEQINAIFASIPKTKQEIELFTQQAVEELEVGVHHFLNALKRDFDNTIRHWHEIISSAHTKRLLLLYGCKETSAAEAVGAKIEQVMHRPDVLMAILRFAENHTAPDSLSPSQRTYAYRMVCSLHTDSSDLKIRIENLEKTLSQQEQHSYTYLQGSAPEKVFAGDSISVLNLNICSFEDRLPLLWGGMLPWKLRMDEMAAQLQAQNPDVICLQEVFDEKAGAALYDHLQKQYRYFYINIAPRNFCLHSSSLGISSGLFVASKYRIENPQFIAFGKNSPPERSYGFFHATVTSQNKILSHVVTTHLQPSEEGSVWREKQIQQILDYMMKIADSAPCLLCGDLNVEWSSQEPAEFLLKKHFFNSNNQNTTGISFNNRTCCEYSDYWWKAGRDIRCFNTKPEIVDYALLLQQPCDKTASIKTTIVPMSDPAFPEEALSDHQALLTKLRFHARIL